MKILNRVKDHAESLVHDLDSNRVEHYNSRVAKFTGGKRINFSLTNSFETRALGAVIDHNSGQLHSQISEKLPRKSPNKLIMKIEAQRAHQNATARKRLFSEDQHKLNRKKIRRSYGYENNGFASVTEEAKLSFLKTLSLDDNQIKILESSTVEQSNSLLWHEERRKRLTASNFGIVCKLRKTTNKDAVAYRLVNNATGSLPALLWGREKEKVAVKILQEKLSITVSGCGFFVDQVYPFLGASPDGLVDNDFIVEIKCPSSARHFRTIKDAIREKKCDHLKLVDDQITVNRRHSYFYQVQGQLRVTGRSKCIFVTWIPEDMHIEHIEMEKTFWQERMEQHLKSFYMQNLLPCIVKSM